MAQMLCLNEGKDYLGLHAFAGVAYYAGGVYGQSVAAGDITATSVLSGLQEETGTGYLRQSKTMGSMTNGILTVPSATWTPAGLTDWHKWTAAFTASASTAGVALFVWDIGGRTGDRASAANGVITNLSQTSDLVVGQKVFGAGIGSGAVISSKDSATQITLSVNNTGTGTGTAIAFEWRMDTSSFSNSQLVIPSVSAFYKNVGE